jgi:mannose-6-phosphate isomerase-like protein (cupin superfamily)
MRVDKVWGHEEILSNGTLCRKKLHVLPGMQCSLHYHPIKEEVFFVEQGECFIQTSLVNPFPPILKVGDSRHIPPGLPHRFGSIEGCIILEVSTHHEDSDVIRIEPSGKIA